MLRKIILVMIAAFVLIPALGRCDAIDWKQYNDGILLAEKQNKKIFLYFRTDWCGYCGKMEHLTFEDQSVARFLNEHFVCIKVNGDKEPLIVKRYQVIGYPDSRFLDEKKKEAYRLPGFADAGAFLVLLEYIQTDSYKTMDPMQYYKSR